MLVISIKLFLVKGKYYMSDSYSIWLARASNNLTLAKIKLPKGACYEDLCFNAQQAAEKALKSLLVFYDVEPPRTHDLAELVNKASKYTDLPKNIRNLVKLNEYAVQIRYPGDYIPLTKKDHTQAVRIAENCLDWVKTTIKTNSKQLRL